MRHTSKPTSRISTALREAYVLLQGDLRRCAGKWRRNEDGVVPAVTTNLKLTRSGLGLEA
jgi:hypothetical protein